MKRKFISLVLLLCLLLCLPGTALADGEALLYDYEGLLSGDEADYIAAALEDASLEYGMIIAILTVDSLDGKSAEEYADDFYDDNGLGEGEDCDGLLLLVSMAERKWHISTTGYAIYAFPDYYLDSIGEDITPFLADGDCYSAFDAFIRDCRAYLAEDMEDEGYEERRDNYSDEDFYDFSPAETSSGPRFIWIPIAICIGLVVALIAMSIMKRGMKSVRMQSAAADYVRAGSFSLRESRDVFLYTTVSKTPKPKDNDRQGGIGAGGNFSSTHMSGGGSVHGGRGGSF